MLLLIIFLDPKKSWIPSTVILIISCFFSLSLINTSGYLRILSSNLDLIRTTLVSLTILISSLIIIARQKIFIYKKIAKYFLMLVTSLTITLFFSFTAQRIILFYIFFEASLVPTLFIILGWGYQPERMQAGIYLIIYTVTASLPLLLSLIMIYKNSGHLSITLPNWTFPLIGSQRHIWWVLTIAAFLVKTPLYLTHLWLPKAHVEAPVAGSIILAGVLLKLGSYGLLRVSSKFIFLNKSLAPALISLSLIGGVIARFICLRQTDVKALIAYSSISHIGIATAGIISNTNWGWHGALIILIAHGLCSSCLFSLANVSYETIQSRRIYTTKGLITFFPAITFWWFCFSATNIAAPPSINLGAEILLIAGTLSFSWLSALPLGLIRFIAAAYSLLIYTTTQHGNPPQFQNPLHTFVPRNYSICFIHFAPIILLIIKIDLISIWIWPYSWKTTLNCKFKSV